MAAYRSKISEPAVGYRYLRGFLVLGVSALLPLRRVRAQAFSEGAPPTGLLSENLNLFLYSEFADLGAEFRLIALDFRNALGSAFFSRKDPISATA